MSDKLIIYKDPSNPKDIQAEIDLTDKIGKQKKLESSGKIHGRKVKVVDQSIKPEKQNDKKL